MDQTFSSRALQSLLSFLTIHIRTQQRLDSGTVEMKTSETVMMQKHIVYFGQSYTKAMYVKMPESTYVNMCRSM